MIDYILKGEIDIRYIKITWEDSVKFWHVSHLNKVNTCYAKKWFHHLWWVAEEYRVYKFEGLVFC